MGLEILLIDGTNDREVEEAVKTAVREVSRGSGESLVLNGAGYNLESYDFMNSLCKEDYDDNRDQVDFKTLAKSLYKESKDYDGLILGVIEYDLYNQGLNFCFGGSTTVSEEDDYGGEKDKELIISSINRVRTLGEKVYLITHELGHKLGATRREFNVEYKGGVHCVNEDCVMNQQSDLSKVNSFYEKFKLGELDSLFCTECRETMKD